MLEKKKKSFNGKRGLCTALARVHGHSNAAYLFFFCLIPFPGGKLNAISFSYIYLIGPSAYATSGAARRTSYGRSQNRDRIRRSFYVGGITMKFCRLAGIFDKCKGTGMLL